MKTTPMTYVWDANGDGSRRDATGVSPTLSWTQLQALGLATLGVYANIPVRVDDGHGHSTVSAAAQLTMLWAGDANADGKVSFADYPEQNFGKSISFPAPASFAAPQASPRTLLSANQDQIRHFVLEQPWTLLFGRLPDRQRR
jgi:hypothetical protein